MHNESPAPVIALLSLIIIISPWAEKTATTSPHYLGQTKRQSHAQVSETQGSAVLWRSQVKLIEQSRRLKQVTLMNQARGEGHSNVKYSISLEFLHKKAFKMQTNYIYSHFISEKRSKSCHWEGTLQKLLICTLWYQNTNTSLNVMSYFPSQYYFASRSTRLTPK